MLIAEGGRLSRGSLRDFLRDSLGDLLEILLLELLSGHSGRDLRRFGCEGEKKLAKQSTVGTARNSTELHGTATFD